MNTIETLTDKNNPSRRIRILSQVLKGLVLIYLVVIPLVSILSPALVQFAIGNYVLLPGQSMGGNHVSTGNSDLPVSLKLVDAMKSAVFLLGAVVVYRLLNLYEKGSVFSSAHVRQFRFLGWLIFSKGLLAVAAFGVLASHDNTPVFPSVLFYFFRSTWVMGGLFCVLLSFIMKEGCKLQEEQELTV